MITEEDFQKQLDEHIEDWTTRLVLADYLEEIGDKRAEGYRVLGKLRRWPTIFGKKYGWFCNNKYSSDLEQDWFRLIYTHGSRVTDYDTATRKEMEDKTALMWLELDQKVKEEILNAIPANK